ncbi:hypothetical protein ABZ023_07725 [Streptomyces sp. NPDC006367]|uniref:hypothetical protein n=1 Tax=unclassified Streptomyces TaxID=2593676 RepID=UPI0033BA6583
MSADTGDRGGLFADGTDRERRDRAARGGARQAAVAGAGRGVVGAGVPVLFSDLAPSATGHPPAGVPSVTGASPAGATPAATGSPSTGAPSAGAGASGVPGGAPSPGARPAPVPRARTTAPRGASPRREKRQSRKIAQRIVPDDLQPDVLRQELVELGDAFRAYQRRPEPDLALLAELHDRKARAFTAWAAVTDDASLLEEAKRAEAAARTTREMNANRLGVTADGDGPAIERLLTRGQGAHARRVLEHIRTHAPLPGSEARLAVLMLTLRSARAGTGNVTGQDLNGWLQSDAERVLQQLVDAGWLRLPEEDTVADALDSRPEDPTQVTVPSLLPGEPRPFFFGKVTRARLSGWAQKVVGDRKIRKKKPTAATRLLAVYTAAHSRPDGRIDGCAEDAGGEGLGLDAVAVFCGLRSEDVAAHVDRLVAADWLAEADVTGGRLRGRLAERVLPLSGLV